MTADPRAALNKLIATFERHLEASAGRNGEDDPRVVAAYEDLADAFEAYDDALNDAYGEMTPLIVVDDADLDGGDDGVDSDDEGYVEDEDDDRYSGLDDEDYDDDRDEDDDRS